MKYRLALFFPLVLAMHNASLGNNDSLGFVKKIREVIRLISEYVQKKNQQNEHILFLTGQKASQNASNNAANQKPTHSSSWSEPTATYNKEELKKFLDKQLDTFDKNVQACRSNIKHKSVDCQINLKAYTTNWIWKNRLASGDITDFDIQQIKQAIRMAIEFLAHDVDQTADMKRVIDAQPWYERKDMAGEVKSDYEEKQVELKYLRDFYKKIFNETV